jgi:hypothetical protein
VGDGAAERTGRRPLGIDVDPLVVAGGVGEEINLLLSHRAIVAETQVGAHERSQIIDAFDVCGHNNLLTDSIFRGGLR